MVGAVGIEPTTPSMSPKCSAAELRALKRPDQFSERHVPNNTAALEWEEGGFILELCGCASTGLGWSPLETHLMKNVHPHLKRTIVRQGQIPSRRVTAEEFGGRPDNTQDNRLRDRHAGRDTGAAKPDRPICLCIAA